MIGPAQTTDVAAAPTTACEDTCCSDRWQRGARLARRLAWASLVWMTIEGAIGLYAGVSAGSIALVGWALGSVIEGLASVIVVWRFSGWRTTSATAERTAQRAVAVSFWLLAPYIAVESIHRLIVGERASSSLLGIVLTGSSVILMPLLGRAKQRLARTLDSPATAGEGVQNYLCAAQGAGVLVALTVTAAWPAAWWLDGAIGLAIAAWSLQEGRNSWRGSGCC